MLLIAICVAFYVLEIGGFCFEYPKLESNSDGVAEKQVSLLPKTKGFSSSESHKHRFSGPALSLGAAGPLSFPAPPFSKPVWEVP